MSEGQVPSGPLEDALSELVKMSGGSPADLLWALAVALPVAGALLWTRLRRPAVVARLDLLGDRRRG